MRRAYFIVPLLMAGLSASYYFWRVSKEAENEVKTFLTDGPGALRQTKKILVHTPLRELLDGQKRADFYGSDIQGPSAIASILVAISLDDRRWTRRPTRATRGIALWFFADDRARIEVRIGEDFIACGSYARSVSPDTVVTIREMLIKTGAS